MNDVSFVGSEGVTLSIGVSKGDQEGDGREVSIPRTDLLEGAPFQFLDQIRKFRLPDVFHPVFDFLFGNDLTLR
jgi:hypothetical protein